MKKRREETLSIVSPPKTTSVVVYLCFLPGFFPEVGWWLNCFIVLLFMFSTSGYHTFYLYLKSAFIHLTLLNSFFHIIYIPRTHNF